jgi:hypothetical protein
MRPKSQMTLAIPCMQAGAQAELEAAAVTNRVEADDVDLEI